MPKKSTNHNLMSQTTNAIDESALLKNVSSIIENRKYRDNAYANSEVTLMFWEVGQFVTSVLLGGERAEHGKIL